MRSGEAHSKTAVPAHSLLPGRVRAALAAPWLPPLLVLLAAAAAGVNTLAMAFVWDDIPQVRDNALLRSLATLPQLFATNVSAGTTHYDPNVPYYRPLALATFSLDRFLWAENPFGYHLTNLLLHCGVTLLVWRLAHRLAGPVAALTAGLLFAVYPVHAEAVAWISARFDLLAALFTVAAFGSYLAFRENGRRLFLAASTLLFLAALLCKEMAITLPLLVFLHESCLAKSHRGESCRRAGVFAVVALVYYGIRLAVLENHAWNTYPAAWHLATAAVLVTQYLRLLIFPFHLPIFHDIPLKHTLLDPEVIAKGTLLLALLAGTARLLRHDRVARFGLLWIFVTLLPVSGLVTFPLPALLAERYLYLPSVGFCLAAGALFAKLRSRGLTVALPCPTGSCRWPDIFAATAVIVLLAISCARNGAWQDDLHLFAYKLQPETANARYCRGVLAYREGKLPEAVREFTRALQLDPALAPAHNDLGITLATMGRVEESRREFQVALSLEPTLGAAADNLARLGYLEGRKRDGERNVR